MAGFDESVVAAVVRHMNEDHADDTLLIVRALGGLDGAASARMMTWDADGGDYLAVVDDVETSVRIPWSHRLTERAEVRAEVVAMYERACEALGLEPRPH